MPIMYFDIVIIGWGGPPIIAILRFSSKWSYLWVNVFIRLPRIASKLCDLDEIRMESLVLFFWKIFWVFVSLDWRQSWEWFTSTEGLGFLCIFFRLLSDSETWSGSGCFFDNSLDLGSTLPFLSWLSRATWSLVNC